MLTLVVVSGMLINVLPADAEIISFNHQTSGRLAGVNYGDGKNIAFSYDLAGNLTSRQFLVGLGGDSDNDGMDDAWEMTYFMTLDRDGMGDFDNDGMSDISEFLAGTLPNDPNSLLRIVRVTPTSGVGAFIEWTSVPGKRYVVQYKNSLNAATWSQLVGEIEAVGATSSATDNTYSGTLPRFYRVALSNGEVSPMSPVLSVMRINNQLSVSWASSTPANFSLESATNLAPAMNWSAVTNSISDNGSTKSVLLPVNPSEQTRFFRLRE